ncbi:MAG: hypothetical protein R2702_19135 [Acidimicrobiales bacterium]
MAPRPAAVAALALVLAATSAGCTDDGGSTASFCAQVRQVPALETVLARFDETDPDVLADRIDKARAAYDALADAAPGDVRDETASVVALVDEVLDAVTDHPTDPAAAADQLRRAVADHPEAEQARAKVASFAQRECDVRLDPTLAPSEGTTTSAATATTAVADAETSTTGG